MTRHGIFHWNELNTRNAEKAVDFYRKSIGWTFDEMPMGEDSTYYICKQGETPVAGIFTMSGPDFEDVPEHWFSYLAVDDIDARIVKAVSEGAIIQRPAFDAPGVGRIAIIKDPNGAAIGWMTPAD